MQGSRVMPFDPDHPGCLDAWRFSGAGDCPVRVEAAGSFRSAGPPLQALVIGVDREGALPEVDAGDFDLLLTTAAGAARPWVHVPIALLDRHVEQLRAAVAATPVAAALMRQTLRLTEGLSAADGMLVESLAYSTLLGGGEFEAWKAGRADGEAAQPCGDGPLVRYSREDARVVLTLDDPGRRNAMTAAMRDALFEALVNVLEDPSRPDVVLRGAGRCFSVGGHLPEFGSARDLAMAHVIRTTHGCAGIVAALGRRITTEIHGACIGSGLEVPAAGRMVARRGGFFQLPELRMGLIPGAGGTVTVGRRIGRHRLAWLLLTGRRVTAAQALEMGLIEAILP